MILVNRSFSVGRPSWLKLCLHTKTLITSAVCVLGNIPSALHMLIQFILRARNFESHLVQFLYSTMKKLRLKNVKSTSPLISKVVSGSTDTRT